ncbi:winged helix-turn-helix domain-containing protein [Streptomyces sp. NPDC090442]|uniref:winged helix-turn-helix domain-containing protein n=1 Tax=Streptomyces sp. NPDC090442 TaxID=3365962 RepID=UPI00381EEFEC
MSTDPKSPGGAAAFAGGHPRHGLDEVIHAPVRFSIVATLAAAEKAEFAFVRDTVEVSDSVLSRQVATLEKAGYVAVTKGYIGKRPRTWLALTSDGRAAFAAHCRALRAIAGDDT